MGLVSTGEISIGGNATSGSLNRSINIELGRAAGATSNLNETALRTLAGIPTSGSTISLASFFGKSNFTVGYNSSWIYNGAVFDDVYDSSVSEPGASGLRWQTNGTMDQFNYSTGYSALGAGWGAPTTTGIGSNYWIRFTRTATNSFGSPTAAAQSTASTGWLQLNFNREIYIDRSPGQNFFGATYTIEISSSSSGSPVLSTLTGVVIQMSDSFL
jgi:hypothetical protein